MSLAERLRGIVTSSLERKPDPSRLGAGSAGPRPEANGRSPASAPAPAGVSLESVLDGAWHTESGGRCFIVERPADPDVVHGGVRIGDLAGRLRRGADAIATLAGAPVAAPPVFFDLETTGLSGGAGTYPFLVGCAWFDEAGGLVVRQYLLPTVVDERSMLQSVAARLDGAGALVSFNGKSFDAPLLETRYLFHRLEWRARSLPHIDVLHPARSFWGGSPAEEGCSLVALERQVLGFRRDGDVAGLEIPARYFQFVRSGDPRPLAAVLAHNRLDLLSLAGLCVRLLLLLQAGADNARTAQEALALGKLYARAGRESDARRAFERAALMSASGRGGSAIHVASLVALARADRRARRHAEAEQRWREVLEVPGCPDGVAREALEALAVHHEHRARDLDAARTFALKTLEMGSTRGRVESARYRLSRIERKLVSATPGRLFASS